MNFDLCEKLTAGLLSPSIPNGLPVPHKYLIRARFHHWDGLYFNSLTEILRQLGCDKLPKRTGKGHVTGNDVVGAASVHIQIKSKTFCI